MFGLYIVYMSVGQQLSTIFHNFFVGVGCAIINSWLDFGGVPDHNVDTGISNQNFYHRSLLHVLLLE